MKAFTATALALAAAGARAAVPLSQVKASPPLPVVSNRYVVEVGSLSDLPARRGERAAHAAVYANLHARGVGYTVDNEYDEDVFKGASIQLDNPNDLAALAATPGVISVRPVVLIPAPKPASFRVATANDTGADTESTHIVTGVNKLHAEGLLGSGIKIGIIDTGTDYKHPSLGGGFGAGFKVAGGYDFVGDAFTGSNTPHPDSDPYDNCNGHGTHVAGIIGANPGNQYNISGVAYKSSLYSYRVFGCSGSTPDDIIVAGLLRAYKDGNDVITLSLGGVQGWTESASADVASRIARAGRIVTIAAGNDGAYGSWYSSSPGNGLDVISVASVDNTVVTVATALVSGVDHAPIPYNSLKPLPIPGTLPVYATSNSTTVPDDACAALPASTPDLSGYVVLIRRGTCNFTQKLANAAAKGAQYFLIYNNVPGLAAISVGNYTAALIEAEDGAFLVEQIAAGKQPKLTFPQSGSTANIPNPTGGQVSSFTSYGPTFDMYFKPAVAAPGGNILSTYPIALGTWAVLSGTSMATPFMAGVSALLFQAKGKTAAVAAAARNIYETTAQPVLVNSTTTTIQTLTQSGAGLVNAYSAVHSTVSVSPGEFLLNDTAHFKPLQTFKITNNGKTAKKFTLSHVPAGTALTINGLEANVYPVPLVSAAAGVTFSRPDVTVAPGQTQSLTAHFTAPKGLNAANYPAYSGYVVLSCGNETYRISYLGVAAALKNKQVLDTSSDYFGVPLPAFLNSTGDVQAAPTNYTLQGADAPSVLFRLAFGTARLTLDLVAPSTKVPTSGTYASVKTLGQLAEYDYTPRNSAATTAQDNGYSTFTLDSTFANNGTIPKGQYKVLLRALRVTGDRTKEADYESYLSPTFGVV